MVEKNKRYKIEITDISSDGNGVGTIDGFVVFVPVTAIGDIAEIVIVKVLSGYAIGRLITLISPSPDRCEPVCPIFRRCGGCQLQHINYDAQLNIKKRFIEAAMQRIGGFDGFECNEMLAMEKPYRYRNKCIFPIGTDRNGETICGFYAQRSHDIIEVSDCVMGSEINSEINTAILEYMYENNVPPYNEANHSGLVRRVFIRSAAETNEIMVVISINGNNIPQRERLIKRLRNVSKNIVSIYININNEKNNNVLGKTNRLIYGKEVIEDELCQIRFKISPHSFYQINPYMTERLYSKALEYADITKDDTVLDIYCGIGTISLAAAKRAKHVTGIEIVPAAVINARENAENNGISNVDFYAQSAEEAVTELIKNGLRPDIVILDPPRKGSDIATLNAIAYAAPKRIVYVSCNPSTLARDAKHLSQLGYSVTACAGADMFSHTHHVETVCLITKS